MVARGKYHCAYCGSENILRDSFSEWCDETQKWVHSSELDGAQCCDCGRTELIYVEFEIDGAVTQDVREKLAQLIIRCSLATGHGDTVDDLLGELEWQIKRVLNKLDGCSECLIVPDLIPPQR